MKVSLIIFFIGFLTIAPSIYVGVKYFDGKVTDQPYETGLNYDADKKFLKDNGLEINIIDQQKNADKITLKFKISDKNTSVDRVEFAISRPATNKDMKMIEADASSDGTYASVFTIDSEGYYVLMAKGTLKGKNISLQKSFYIN